MIIYMGAPSTKSHYAYVAVVVKCTKHHFTHLYKRVS